MPSMPSFAIAAANPNDAEGLFWRNVPGDAYVGWVDAFLRTADGVEHGPFARAKFNESNRLIQLQMIETSDPVFAIDAHGHVPA